MYLWSKINFMKEEEKKKKKKRSGNTNRRKGHNAERYYCNIFKDMGFEYCVTSRLGSRLLDNAKVDLMNLPFNLQIKAGKQTSMNPGRELFSMECMIKTMFPPEDEIHNKSCFLVHKKEVGRGNKTTIEDQLVFMSMDEWKKFKQRDSTLHYLFDKKFKFSMDSEFRHIVALPFEIFKNKIIIKYYIK